MQSLLIVIKPLSVGFCPPRSGTHFTTNVFFFSKYLVDLLYDAIVTRSKMKSSTSDVFDSVLQKLSEAVQHQHSWDLLYLHTYIFR